MAQPQLYDLNTEGAGRRRVVLVREIEGDEAVVRHLGAEEGSEFMVRRDDLVPVRSGPGRMHERQAEPERPKRPDTGGIGFDEGSETGD